MKIIITEVSGEKSSTTEQAPSKKTKVTLNASMISEKIRKKAEADQAKISNAQK